MSNLTTKNWTPNDTYDVPTEFTRIQEILEYCNENCNKEIIGGFLRTTQLMGTINNVRGYMGISTFFIGKNKKIIAINVFHPALEYSYSYEIETGYITINAITSEPLTSIQFNVTFIENFSKEWNYFDIPYQTDILRYIDGINLILKKYNQEEQEFTQVDYFNLTLANELEQGLAKCLNLINNE